MNKIVSLLTGLLLSTAVLNTVSADKVSHEDINKMTKIEQVDEAREANSKLSKDLQGQLDKAKTSLKDFSNQSTNANKTTEVTKSTVNSNQADIKNTEVLLDKANQQATEQEHKVKAMWHLVGTDDNQDVDVDHLKVKSNPDMVDKLVATNKLQTTELKRLKFYNNRFHRLQSIQDTQKQVLADNQAKLSNDNKTSIDKSKQVSQLTKQVNDLNKSLDSVNDSNQQLANQANKITEHDKKVKEQALEAARKEEARKKALADKLAKEKAKQAEVIKARAIARKAIMSKQSSNKTVIKDDEVDNLADEMTTNAFVDKIASFLGTPYVWGGTTPDGFDCSGLVQYAAREVGVSLPRVSQSQSVSGKPVSFDDLKTGVLLFWGGEGTAYHVAVYIGNGAYIHAPKPGDYVKVGYISKWTPDTARRINGLTTED